MKVQVTTVRARSGETHGAIAPGIPKDSSGNLDAKTHQLRTEVNVMMFWRGGDEW